MYTKYSNYSLSELISTAKAEITPENALAYELLQRLEEVLPQPSRESIYGDA